MQFSDRVDIPALLSPVRGSNPSGEDIEYENATLTLFRKADGEPERQMGNAVKAAVPPDWREVVTAAPVLLGRSKDLRIAMVLCRALVHLDGVAGAATGLSLLTGMVEKFWGTLYPARDQADGDPTARVNVLAELNRDETFRKIVLDSPFARDLIIGPITVRQIVRGAGAGRQPRDLDPTQARPLLAQHAAIAERIVAAAESAATSLSKMQEFLDQEIGELAPDFASTIGLFKQIVQAFRPAFGPVAAPLATGDGAAAVVAVGHPGVITSQKDVVATLDAICAYYESAEPSSPVPFLLKRAKRLVGAGFGAILMDVASEGVSQFEKISGVRLDE